MSAASLSSTASHEVIFDIETQNSFDEVGGYFPEKLDVSLVGCYFYATDTYESYLHDDLPALFTRLERNGRMIGYNSIGFDIPVLRKYYVGNLLTLPQLDILQHIERALGFRVKLDDVAKATVGAQKSGHGLQAVQWWKEGKIEEIRKYCLDDVRITKEVYEFGCKNGFVLWDDRNGERRAIPVNFTPTAPTTSVNLSLGF